MTGEAVLYLTTLIPKHEQVAVQRYASSTQWAGSISSFYLSEWQKEALKGIIRLQYLEENWDHEGSSPPSRIAIETGKLLILELPFDDLPTPFVTPTSVGGLQLEWTDDQREIEIEVLTDGSLEFLKAENGNVINEGLISGYEVLGLFNWVRPEPDRPDLPLIAH